MVFVDLRMVELVIRLRRMLCWLVIALNSENWIFDRLCMTVERVTYFD